jgi:hypothetical protein
MLSPLALLLIAGLSSPDFATREACTEALSVCPELVGPPLWWHYPDPETEHRLRRVREHYEPPRMVGTWKVADGSENYTWVYHLERHGRGYYEVADWADGPRRPFRWQLRGSALTFAYDAGVWLECLRVQKDGRPLHPDVTVCRWAGVAGPCKGRVLWTAAESPY